MLIGFNAPTAGPLSAADNLAKIVVGAEAMGFDYATFSDHIVIPTAIAAEYPYSASGEFPSGTRGERHEQLTEIAWIAAKTTRLRLVTSVMVVPHRPAVLTAKILSTIDVLSGGRLTLGIGAGWMREEFEAIGAPDFDARGTVTDEYVRAFVELWTRDAPKFDGKYVAHERGNKYAHSEGAWKRLGHGRLEMYRWLSGPAYSEAGILQVRGWEAVWENREDGAKVYLKR